MIKKHSVFQNPLILSLVFLKSFPLGTICLNPWAWDLAGVVESRQNYICWKAIRDDCLVTLHRRRYHSCKSTCPCNFSLTGEHFISVDLLQFSMFYLKGRNFGGKKIWRVWWNSIGRITKQYIFFLTEEHFFSPISTATLENTLESIPDLSNIYLNFSTEIFPIKLRLPLNLSVAAND